MTRFKFNGATNCIEYDGKSILLDSYGEDIEELLNELHEENQYLKSLKWNQDCINEISIGIQQRQSLEKENEQLKKDIEYLKTERLALFEYLDKKDDLKLELKVKK